MQSCELANARDLNTWSKTINSTNSFTTLKVGDNLTRNQDEAFNIFENHFSKMYKNKKKTSFERLLDRQERETEMTTKNEISLDELKRQSKN